MDYIKDNYDYIKLPKEQIISMEVEPYPYGSIPTYTITFKGTPIMSSNIKNTNIKNTKILIDNINNINNITDYAEYKPKLEGVKRTMELLRLYKKFRYEELENNYNKKRENILSTDKFAIKAKEYNEFLKLNEISNDMLDIDRILEDDTLSKLDEINKERDNDKKSLETTLDMLECHLDLANTFDEKQNLLRVYGIIDDEGKLKTFASVNEISIEVGEIPVKPEEIKIEKKVSKRWKE